MEQPFDSEESISGCESGWTLYLQHDSINPHDHVFSWTQASNAHEHEHEHEHDHQEHEDDDNDDEEEEDDDDDHMSMVSDASSGPPHFQPHQEHEEEDEYFNEDNSVFCDPPLTLVARKRRKLFNQTSFNGHRHFQDLAAVSLDDTASSPFFSFSSKEIQVCNKQSKKEDNNSFCYSHGHSTTYFEIA